MLVFLSSHAQIFFSSALYDVQHVHTGTNWHLISSLCWFGTQSAEIDRFHLGVLLWKLLFSSYLKQSASLSAVHSWTCTVLQENLARVMWHKFLYDTWFVWKFEYCGFWCPWEPNWELFSILILLPTIGPEKSSRQILVKKLKMARLWLPLKERESKIVLWSEDFREL